MTENIEAMYDLTIIIPHYNTPIYLKELLKSIPALENIQVIVVDDRSDDGFGEYCAIMSDPEFSHVTFLENTTKKKNAGTCRNIGLQHAEGKWLLFADADDFFVEGFYNAIEKYFASNFDVVFFIPTSMDRDTMQISTRHISHGKIMRAFHNSQTLKNELFLRYKINAPWSKMISLDFVRKCDISFSEVIAANDSAFSTKVGHYMQSFTTSKETIYCATNNTGSLTKSRSEELYDARFNEFIWKYNFIRANISKKEFSILGFCGVELIYRAYRYGLGYRKIVDVLKKLRKNRVRIIDIKFLNISNLRNKLTASKNSHRFVVRE